MNLPLPPCLRAASRLAATTRRAALAALAFAALATGGAGIARAARGDVDVLVAPDRTEAGKKFVPPTAQKPYYCLIHCVGPMEAGAIYAGENIPKKEDVAPFVKSALAGQHYLEIDEAHPEPSLVIVYGWGSINPDEMEIDLGDGVTVNQQINRNQMLAIVGTNKLDLHPNSVDYNLFLPPLDSGRYFILVGALDYAALKAGKTSRQAMLWRTRLSTYNTGAGITDMAHLIPRMLELGAGAFGADGYPHELRSKLKKGVVTIGEAEVREYIVSGTGVRPAPAKRKKTDAAPAPKPADSERQPQPPAGGSNP